MVTIVWEPSGKSERSRLSEGEDFPEDDWIPPWDGPPLGPPLRGRSEQQFSSHGPNYYVDVTLYAVALREVILWGMDRNLISNGRKGEFNNYDAFYKFCADILYGDNTNYDDDYVKGDPREIFIPVHVPAGAFEEPIIIEFFPNIKPDDLAKLQVELDERIFQLAEETKKSEMELKLSGFSKLGELISPPSDESQDELILLSARQPDPKVWLKEILDQRVKPTFWPGRNSSVPGVNSPNITPPPPAPPGQ